MWRKDVPFSALPSTVVEAYSSIVFKQMLDCVDLTKMLSFLVFLFCILLYVIMYKMCVIMLGHCVSGLFIAPTCPVDFSPLKSSFMHTFGPISFNRHPTVSQNLKFYIVKYVFFRKNHHFLQS